MHVLTHAHTRHDTLAYIYRSLCPNMLRLYVSLSCIANSWNYLWMQIATTYTWDTLLRSWWWWECAAAPGGLCLWFCHIVGETSSVWSSGAELRINSFIEAGRTPPNGFRKVRRKFNRQVRCARFACIDQCTYLIARDSNRTVDDGTFHLYV